MESLIKENTTRTDPNDDEMERIMDNELEMIGKKSEVPTRGENATGKTQRDMESQGTEIENPFRPRASLSRSPTRLTRNHEGNPGKGDDDDVFEDTVTPKPVEIGMRKEAELSERGKRDDNVLISRDVLKKMSERTRGATTAIKAIFDYAATTKNVSRILKEKSGIALNYLESLVKELAEIQRYGQSCTGAEGPVTLVKPTMVNCATQTEYRIGGEDRTPIRTGDGQDAHRRKVRKETPGEIRESYPVAAEPTAKTGGGDKRKERTPPEPTKTKRSRPNAGQTGNAIQPVKRANEPGRGRTQGMEEPMQADLGNSRMRLSSGCLEPKEQDAGPPLCLPRRRTRRRLVQDERWDYVTNVYERERIPRTLYSEAAKGTRERPYRNTHRKNIKMEYLRKARIPHWEWRGYSSRESSDDDENEETSSREILDPGSHSRLAARGINKHNFASDMRHEIPKGDIPKRAKRPRKRAKPEAVLVRIEQGGTYLETYKTIAGELKTLINGVKGVRKTRTGHLLIEIGQETKVEEVGQRVRRRLGEGAQVRLLQEMTTFQLRGLDPIITKEEVAADMAEAGKIDPAEVSVQTLRPMRDGTQVGIVRVPTRKVNGELRSGRIKIGMVVCRAKTLPDIVRCFRCHQIGHVGAECRNLEKGKSLCRKCGIEGHSMAVCDKSPRCVLCTKTGLEGINARHVAGALNCPTYRGKIISGKNGK